MWALLDASIDELREEIATRQKQMELDRDWLNSARDELRNRESAEMQQLLASMTLDQRCELFEQLKGDRAVQAAQALPE